MEDKKLDVWERQDFPPWSVRILILWMLGFLILSTAIFTVGGMLGAHINISFKLDLSMKEFMSIVSIPSEMLYVGIVSIFVLFQLKRASFSLSDVWGESKILRFKRPAVTAVFQEFDGGIGLLIDLVIIDAGDKNLSGPRIRLKTRDDLFEDGVLVDRPRGGLINPISNDSAEGNNNDVLQNFIFFHHGIARGRQTEGRQTQNTRAKKAMDHR